MSAPGTNATSRNVRFFAAFGGTADIGDYAASELKLAVYSEAAPMNDQTDDLDQADGDSLTNTVSDEALEAATRMASDAATWWFIRSLHFACC
jgi:hypothetical protein